MLIYHHFDYIALFKSPAPPRERNIGVNFSSIVRHTSDILTNSSDLLPTVRFSEGCGEILHTYRECIIYAYT